MTRRSRHRRTASEAAARSRRPRVHPLVHLGLLIVTLVMVIMFGGELSDRAAGCYTHATGDAVGDAVQASEPARPASDDDAPAPGSVRVEFRAPETTSASSGTDASSGDDAPSGVDASLGGDVSPDGLRSPEDDPGAKLRE